MGSRQGSLGQDRHGGLVNPAVVNMFATSISPQTTVPLFSDALERLSQWGLAGDPLRKYED